LASNHHFLLLWPAPPRLTASAPCFSTFTADAGGCVIVIKNVPSRICGQCGEVTYDGATARRLEQIAGSVKASTAAEIAVVAYSPQAA
jgi:YgiT-type zinc finger domain-containing protein